MGNRVACTRCNGVRDRDIFAPLLQMDGSLRRRRRRRSSQGNGGGVGQDGGSSDEEGGQDDGADDDETVGDDHDEEAEDEEEEEEEEGGGVSRGELELLKMMQVLYNVSPNRVVEVLKQVHAELGRKQE